MLATVLNRNPFLLVNMRRLYGACVTINQCVTIEKPSCVTIKQLFHLALSKNSINQPSQKDQTAYSREAEQNTCKAFLQLADHTTDVITAAYPIVKYTCGLGRLVTDTWSRPSPGTGLVGQKRFRQRVEFDPRWQGESENSGSRSAVDVKDLKDLKVVARLSGEAGVRPGGETGNPIREGELFEQKRDHKRTSRSENHQIDLAVRVGGYVASVSIKQGFHVVHFVNNGDRAEKTVSGPGVDLPEKKRNIQHGGETRVRVRGWHQGQVQRSCGPVA